MADCDPRISMRDDFDSFKIQRVDDTVIPMLRSEHLEFEGKKRFPSRELAPATILERWGKGYYIASLFTTVGSGKTFRGFCRAFVIDDEGGVRRLTPPSKRSPENDEGTPIERTEPLPVETRAPVATSTVFAPLPLPPVTPPPTGDPIAMFMWMVQIQRDAQAEKERSLEQERSRMRLDAEDRIARERANSSIQLQQQKDFFEAMMKLNKRPEPDGGALAAIESRLEEIQEQLDGDDDDEEQQEKAQQSDLAVAINGVKELLAPAVPVLMQRFANGAADVVK